MVSSNTTTIKQIIQTNLVLLVDSTNTSSYSGTGSRWTDLSGKLNNMTLYNCTYDNKAIVFNGTTSYVLSKNLTSYFTASNYTDY